MTRKKEEFVPLEEGKVKMYVCGPTVYNYIHIGNARPMIVFDTVRRYFEYKGYDVTAQADLTSYTDSSKVSPYAVPAMKWAVASGLIVGNDNKLDPQADVVRCQTAAIFHRFCTKIAE